MIPARSFSGKRVALFGLGGSGIATALALMEGGAEVLAWDGEAAVSPVRLADLAPGPGYAAAAAVLTDRPLKVTEIPW